jgi:hypothetical protein
VAASLVGRDQPLRALRDALDGTLAGRGRLVLLTGEAGIGKSALAAALASEAESRGANVVWGRAWEFADAPPYFPVWPCLRALGIETDANALAQPFQLWERVVAALAQRTHTVWILEDVHAADLGTLDLLTFLALPVRAMGVLIVATVRTGEARVTERMQQRFARIARDGLELALAPLSDGDIAQVLETALDRAAPAAAVARLRELTGGNPLFVVECARVFRAAGGIEGTLGVLPSTVRQVVLDRLATLPDATRDALGAAAVLGREFTAGTLAKMAGVLPARTIDAVLPAVRAGIVAEQRPGAFAFVHGLVRDAVEDSFGDEARAKLHERACAALAALGDSADVLVERARHALAAARTGDPRTALELAARATSLLEREGAVDRALELHLRVEAARAAGFLPPADFETKLHVARVAREARRSEVTRRLCDEVIAQARADGNAEWFARAALLAGEDIRVAVIDTHQVQLLREARERLGAKMTDLACRVLARLATALLPTFDMTEPRALAREAIRGARELGDDRVILDVLDVGVWAFFDAPVDDRIAWSSEAVELAVAAGDLEKALRASAWLAGCRVGTGDFAQWESDVAAMLAMSEELGHPRHRWPPLLYASGVACARGRFAESERHVTEVSQLAALTDDPALPAALVIHDVMRANMARREDELTGALARLDAAMREMRDSGEHAAVIHAYCMARREDLDATRDQLARFRHALPALTSHVGPRALVAEAVALAGTDDERRAALASLADHPEEHYGGQFTFTYEGPIARQRALLHASLGDVAVAERGLRGVRDLARERGHLPWLAQVTYELGKVVQRAGRASESAELLREAHQLAGELGMTGLAGSATASADLGARTLVLAREGDVWRVERGGTAVRVKDSRGMQLLARLVDQRGREVHVLTLASDEAGSAPESDAGEVIDESARRAYRERLRALEVELADAESAGNAPRATRLERERQALLGELSRAAGLSGRTRRTGSATERARINVQRRLKDAIARIAEADTELGEFLEHSVRTGTFCCYRP